MESVLIENWKHLPASSLLAFWLGSAVNFIDEYGNFNVELYRMVYPKDVEKALCCIYTHNLYVIEVRNRQGNV